MKINTLVTGASGFIGFHIALFLKKRGFNVIGCDNFNPYYSIQLKKTRASLLKQEGINVLNIDINEKEKISALIEKENISLVIHMAAQAGIRYSIENPEEFVKSNLQGFVALMEACKDKDLKILFASSSSVYGTNKKIPFSENDRTDSPANLYGATKKANEAIAFSYHHLYKIPMIGLRFFTVYGPFGRPDMACFSFTDKIAHGKPIDLFNFGKMKRDFTYIDDIVEGIYSAINYKTTFEIFNLGNNHPESLDYLVSCIEKELNKKAIKNLLPMQKGEIEITCADITKSKEKLHYYPKITLEEGIKRFVSWYILAPLESCK